VLGDHYLGGSSGFPAAAGYPHVTVPMGDVHGLPVGLSIMGAAFAEPTLIEIAYAYEQATRHRVPPELEAVAAE
jgi:amidase